MRAVYTSVKRAVTKPQILSLGDYGVTLKYSGLLKKWLLRVYYEGRLRECVASETAMEAYEYIREVTKR